MNKADIKLIARYVVLGFIMYLAYTVSSAEFITQVKDVDPMTLNVIVGAVFAALTLSIKSHFTESIDKD